MKKNMEVLHLEQFHPADGQHGFYAENIRTHVQNHHFTAKPHKHDFFLVVLFTAGSGTHEVDFHTYKIQPGALFLLSPGQTHHWQLSKDIDGTIFFHTREFFDKGFSGLTLKDYPFFGSVYNPPLLRLKKGQAAPVAALFEAILGKQRRAGHMKYYGLLCLVNLLYIRVAGWYLPTVPVKNERYLLQLRRFEDLVDQHFREIKLPSEYAAQMHISERHLNRITHACLNKSPSELIAERNILEAKRLLMREQAPVAEIGAELGYPDNSYFSRFFKKQTGKTPREFAKRYD